MKCSTKSLILSIFINGSGQFFVCKQKIKGIFFFLFQTLFWGIELYTGYWVEYLSGKFSNFEMRLHAGYFTRGIWGIFTLGEVPGARGGDHSTLLLINGIISILIILIFLGLYIFNLVDAYKAGKLIDETGEFQTTKQYVKNLYNKKFPYIILSPITLLLLFVTIMPIIFSFLIAFTNYNQDHLPPGNLVDWVGFSNFAKLFTVPVWSSTLFSVLGWTIIWAVIATLSTYFLGLFQAIILNNKKIKGKKFFRTILILPWAMPCMISLLVFKNVFNGQFGPLNQMLLDWGIITERIPFLTDHLIAKVTIILVNLWLGFPMFMMMMLGVLSNLDQSLYEAARIDGASKFHEFRYITFPLVLKVTLPILVMSFAGNFNNFGAIYFLTEGGPANPNYQFAGDTDILISWIYKLTLDNQMYSMAAVMSILIFIFVAFISVWNFRRTSTFKDM